MEPQPKTENLFEFDTELPADCIEWCPIDNWNKYVICGTYQLIQQEKQTRIGRILLFEQENNDSGQTLRPLNESSVNTSGIFDMKWAFHTINGKPCFGSALSDGSVDICSLNQNSQDTKSISIKTEATWNVNSLSDNSDGNIMSLSVDWSSRVLESEKNEPKIVVSHNDGTITLLKIANNSQIVAVNHWKAHDLEGWIAAFDYHQPELIFSGADDAIFKAWDSRVGFDFPIISQKKTHQAGVCSLHSHPFKSHLLISGSYDETVCMWDKRSLKRPLLQSDPLGGGIWRLKWHPNPDHQTKVIAAAMYDGFKILDVDDNCPSIDVVCEYKEHKSIAYGVDWCFPTEIRKETAQEYHICSCSFYDHALKFWKARL